MGAWQSQCVSGSQDPCSRTFHAHLALRETCGFPVFRDLWATQGTGPKSLWSAAAPTAGAKALLDPLQGGGAPGRPSGRGTASEVSARRGPCGLSSSGGVFHFSAFLATSGVFRVSFNSTTQRLDFQVLFPSSLHTQHGAQTHAPPTAPPGTPISAPRSRSLHWSWLPQGLWTPTGPGQLLPPREAVLVPCLGRVWQQRPPAVGARSPATPGPWGMDQKC